MHIIKFSLSWLFVISTIVYLLCLFSFTSSLKSKYAAYWREIGSPSNSDPNGQMKILSLVFRSKGLPDEIRPIYQRKILVIRLFAFIGLASFAGICLMISLGWFNQ
jgi:hypothetical protein